MNISDHQLVFFIKKKVKDIPIKTTFRGRSYRNYDSQNFIDLLGNCDWEHFLRSEDPNIMWELLLGNIKMSIDQLCPPKDFKIKKFKEPWISRELLELIKDKDNMLKKAKKTKLESDLIVAKRYRNDCLTKIRRAKSDFVKSELDNNRKD